MKNFIVSKKQAEEVKQKINQYQENQNFEPLLCDLNNKHDLLEPAIITFNEEKDRHQVILRCRCKNCKYEQHRIPSFIFDND